MESRVIRSEDSLNVVFECGDLFKVEFYLNKGVQSTVKFTDYNGYIVIKEVNSKQLKNVFKEAAMFLEQANKIHVYPIDSMQVFDETIQNEL